MNIFLKIAIVCVVSYLLGSFNFSIICSRIFQKDDVREHGSGNAGITNYLRNYGGFSTLIVMVGDLGKCIAAVFITTKTTISSLAREVSGFIICSRLIASSPSGVEAFPSPSTFEVTFIEIASRA